MRIAAAPAAAASRNGAANPGPCGSIPRTAAWPAHREDLRCSNAEGNVQDPSVYLDGFERLRTEGRILAYGISTNSLDALSTAMQKFLTPCAADAGPDRGASEAGGDL